MSRDARPQAPNRDAADTAQAQKTGGLSADELQAEQAGELPDREALSILDVGGLDGPFPPASSIDGLLDDNLPENVIGIPVPIDTLPVDRLPVEPLPPVEPPVDEVPYPLPGIIDVPPGDGPPVATTPGFPVEPTPEPDVIGIPNITPPLKDTSTLA